MVRAECDINANINFCNEVCIEKDNIKKIEEI